MVSIHAVMNAKGGVTKTTRSINYAINAAIDGKTVVYLDLDGMPGASRSFAKFDSTGLLARAAADPFRFSIFRLFVEPEKGLEGIALEYDLKEAILSLPQVERVGRSRINTSSIVEDTLRAYDINLDRLGKIILIPNAGSFEVLVNQLNNRASADRTFKKSAVLHHALHELEAGRAQRGLPPIDLFIEDCAGELGLMPHNAARAATTISMPFQASDLALEGVEETAKDINAIRAERSDGYPRVLSAVPSMVQMEEPETLEWLAEDAQKRLATLHIPMSPDIVPFSYDIFTRANRKKVNPWEYNPLDPANLAIRAGYLRDREAIFATR